MTSTNLSRGNRKRNALDDKTKKTVQVLKKQKEKRLVVIKRLRSLVAVRNPRMLPVVGEMPKMLFAMNRRPME